MENKHRITYDSAKEIAFVIHLPDKEVRFTCNEDRIYLLTPNYSTNNVNLANHAIDSVEENQLFHTPRQVQQAKLTRQIYHALGTPSLRDFKAIVRTNAIKNLPITIDDINIAEQVFGPDVGALKGKTTRVKPAPVVADYLEVPKELITKHSNITLCIDGMKINGIPFLTTVS
jgi:hypothetical protein